RRARAQSALGPSEHDGRRAAPERGADGSCRAAVRTDARHRRRSGRRRKQPRLSVRRRRPQSRSRAGAGSDRQTAAPRRPARQRHGRLDLRQEKAGLSGPAPSRGQRRQRAQRPGLPVPCRRRLSPDGPVGQGAPCADEGALAQGELRGRRRCEKGPPVARMTARSVSPPAASARRTARGLLWTAALLIAGLAVLYARVVAGLVGDWIHDGNYSHGFVIPPAAAYLAWQRRADLQRLAPRPSWLGVLVVAGGVGLLLLGQLAAEF